MVQRYGGQRFHAWYEVNASNGLPMKRYASKAAALKYARKLTTFGSVIVSDSSGLIIERLNYGRVMQREE